MQAGKRDEAEAKKRDVAGLKKKQQERGQRRTEVEARMDELLAGLPNIPAEDVPVGTYESENKEI